MSKEKNEPVQTVAPALAPVAAPKTGKQYKVTVDGAAHVYEARDAAEAWAMHNDAKKTAWAWKQKNPIVEEVK